MAWLALPLCLGMVAPPPPPSPPGVGCSGERIYTSATGTVDVTFGPVPGGAELPPLNCAFVLHTDQLGITLSFSQLNLINQLNGTCSPDNAHIRVYDGTTTFHRMLASYSCQTHWSVGSTTGDALVVFTTDDKHSGRFTFEWAPSANTCGNGICEPSADEFDLCLQDCAAATRNGPMPPLSLQHSDTKCARPARHAHAHNAAPRASNACTCRLSPAHTLCCSPSVPPTDRSPPRSPPSCADGAPTMIGSA